MASQPSTTPAPRADNPEVVVVATKKVACDGGGGALGHPKVWYDMSEQDFVECKYCDRLFALKGGSRDPRKSA
jgi:uncharacterized Zn-finger protein